MAASAPRDPAKPGAPVRVAGWIARQFGAAQAYRTASQGTGKIAEITRATIDAMNPSRLREKARHEKFEEAIERMSLTEDDVLAAAQHQRVRALAFMTALAVDVVLLAWWAFSVEIPAFVISTALMLAFASGAITSLFRAWQFRHRQLIGFVEWLNLNDWFGGLERTPVTRR